MAWTFSAKYASYRFPGGDSFSPSSSIPSPESAEDAEVLIQYAAAGGVTCGSPPDDASLQDAAKAVMAAKRAAWAHQDQEHDEAYESAKERLRGLLDTAPEPVEEEDVEEYEHGAESAITDEEDLDALIVEHDVQTSAQTPKGKRDALIRAGVLED